VKASLLAFVLLLGGAFPTTAQESGLRHPLVDRLIGEWVLKGEMAGGQVTHDVEFEWVLGGQYLRFHEVARERDATGAPAYEAIVFIGWDAQSERLACLWLDTTGGEGLTNGVIGYAVPAGDSIPFLFRFPDGSPFHTTFAYDRGTDTWEWHMDGEDNGVRRPFARVTMSRK
jgi:hypothetical protein